jgi:hypothetical protein
MRLIATPSIPLDFDLPKAQLLADLLLNPRADRSVIWFCIVAYQPLIDFLTQYESITIQAMCPKPRDSRSRRRASTFREFQFTGFKRKVPTRLPYWPVDWRRLERPERPCHGSSHHPKSSLPRSAEVSGRRTNTRTDRSSRYVD